MDVFHHGGGPFPPSCKKGKISIRKLGEREKSKMLQVEIFACAMSENQQRRMREIYISAHSHRQP